MTVSARSTSKAAASPRADNAAGDVARPTIHVRLTLSLAGLAMAAAMNSAASSQPVHPRAIHLPPYQGKQNLLIAKVGGQERTFLFDTGEGVTMISPEVAEALGCRPWGNEVGFRMLGERFEAPRCDNVGFIIAGHRSTARTVFVHDIEKLTGPGTPRLDGAIGLDLFDQRFVTLDYANQSLVIESELSLRERQATAAEVPLRVTRYANGGVDVFIGVKTNRGVAWMTLDSANAGPTIFVAPKIAPLLGLKADTKEPQPLEIVLGEDVRLKGLARVFPDMIMDGNIGMQLLRRHVVTLDLRRDKAWIVARPDR